MTKIFLYFIYSSICVNLINCAVINFDFSSKHIYFALKNNTDYNLHLIIKLKDNETIEKVVPAKDFTLLTGSPHKFFINSNQENINNIDHLSYHTYGNIKQLMCKTHIIDLDKLLSNASNLSEDSKEDHISTIIVNCTKGYLYDSFYEDYKLLNSEELVPSNLVDKLKTDNLKEISVSNFTCMSMFYKNKYESMGKALIGYLKDNPDIKDLLVRINTKLLNLNIETISSSARYILDAPTNNVSIFLLRILQRQMTYKWELIKKVTKKSDFYNANISKNIFIINYLIDRALEILDNIILDKLLDQNKSLSEKEKTQVTLS